MKAHNSLRSRPGLRSEIEPLRHRDPSEYALLAATYSDFGGALNVAAGSWRMGLARVRYEGAVVVVMVEEIVRGGRDSYLVPMHAVGPDC